jgi:hypothetical protein
MTSNRREKLAAARYPDYYYFFNIFAIHISKFCVIPSRYGKGGHLFLPSYVMRTHGSRKQQDAVKIVPVKQMQKVFEVQNI